MDAYVHTLKELTSWLSAHASRKNSLSGPSPGTPGRTERTCWELPCEAASAFKQVTCYKPLKAFRSVEKHDGSGKPRLTFNPIKAINSALPLHLPCGHCIGCRIDRVDQWATRCHHEAQMHEYNSFITLTYDNHHLPEDYSVSKREWQLFLKRLRELIEPIRIRFFACGEYGTENLRPHYHALIFGYAFPDREFHSTAKGGSRQFTSAILQQAWPYGRALIGDVTVQSAAYVAGYCMGKIYGDDEVAKRHYLRTHPISGLTVTVQPEFQLQSRRPGIGADWFAKFKGDCFPSDFIVIDGRQRRVPAFYARKLDEAEQKKLKGEHKLKAAQPSKKAERTPARLAVREYIKTDRLSKLQRTLKDDDQ